MNKVTGLFIIGIHLLLAACTSSPEADLVITNARIITGTGEVIENGSVLIKGNRILSIKKEPGSVEGSTVIDAEGKSVLPGLIDAHVHLLIEDLTSLPHSDGELEAFIRDDLPGRLRAFLQSGITTVISTGDFWPAISKVRENIRSGELLGPRLFTSGPVFTAPGGSPAAGPICGSPRTDQDNPWCREHIAAVVESRRQAREAVDRLARAGVDFVKMVSDSISPPGLEQLGPELVAEIIAAAHDHGLKAYAHINEMEHARTIVKFGLDGLVHVPFATSAESRSENLVKVMERRGVTAVTTSVTSQDLRDRFADEGRNELAEMFSDNLRDRLQAIRRIAETDASLVVLGTDTPNLPPAEAFHREVRLLKEANLTPTQIIQATTRNAAVHLGLENELGTLETGKLADLIVVDGNPLEDVSELKNIKVVVKDGVVVVEDT